MRNTIFNIQSSTAGVVVNDMGSYVNGIIRNKKGPVLVREAGFLESNNVWRMAGNKVRKFVDATGEPVAIPE